MRDVVLLCAGAPLTRRKGTQIALDIGVRDGGRDAFVMTLSRVTQQMMANLPDRLWDLLSIASYVHLADRKILRDAATMPDLGENWRRNLSFHIAVRDPAFWNSADINESLQRTIGFLSGDRFDFTFHALPKAPVWQPFLQFEGSGSAPGHQPDEVILFSGGLDSLAGAVDALITRERKVALVSYQSAPIIQAIQSKLADSLRKQVGASRISHVGLGLTHSGEMIEATQRTRSFLFGVVALLVARIHGLSEVRFYENGVVSTNLPLASHVLGTRATRTTHPKALDLYGKLFCRVAAADIRIINPFFWDTKADVVRRITKAGRGDLIAPSFSCGATRRATLASGRHCGVCTQCLDRRFGILAADCGHLEPTTNYAVELMRGERKAGIEAVTAESYVLAANTWNASSQDHFLGSHGEVFRLLPHLGMDVSEAAGRLHRLHVRHGKNVVDVLNAAARTDNILADRLAVPDRSLLGMVLGSLAQDVVVGTGLGMKDGLHRDPVQGEAPVDQQVSDRGIKELARPLTFEIDGSRGEVRFLGGPVLRGRHARILSELLPAYQDGLRAGNGSGAFKFCQLPDLAKRLKLSQQSLRQYVTGLRRELETQFHDAFGVKPAIYDVLESSKWHGYRLNPELRQVASLGSSR